MANRIEIKNNNIYICSISDLEYPEKIKENSVIDGQYAFKSLPQGYLWYNVSDMDFKKINDLTYTLSTREDHFLLGTYYCGKTKNKHILRLVKMLLNKEFAYLEDYHNLPILFYLNKKLNLKKPTEFRNEQCDDKHKIFDVFNDQTCIGKVVVSDKFILNSGDQAGVTMPVSHAHSKNDDIIYNGFGNYIWTAEMEEEEDLTQYYDDSYSKIQNVTYFKHESDNDYKDEYDPNLIYVFSNQTYKLIKTIPKDENFITQQQNHGRYLDRGDFYVHNISKYRHLKYMERERFLERIYNKYNVRPTFITMVLDANGQTIIHSERQGNNSFSSDLKSYSESPPHSVHSLKGTNEHRCSISILPCCSTDKFKQLVQSLFTFYLDGGNEHSTVIIDFNVQLEFENINTKTYCSGNKLFINEGNIINKTSYINNCLRLYKILIDHEYRLLHAFIENSLVCVFTNHADEKKIKIEVIDHTSFEYLGKVNNIYPHQLKVINYY